MNKKNTLVIKGNVTSSFIQQDTSNSTQNGNFNFDYDAGERLFKSIEKLLLTEEFSNEFGSMKKEINDLVEEGIKLSKTASEKIKTILVNLKDIAQNVSCGIISTGICSGISKLLEEILEWELYRSYRLK